MSEDLQHNPKPDVKRENDRISALYHASPRIEPPAHLDEDILAASRRAVKTRPRVMSPFSGRWYLPASMAAVLIIAVTLVPLSMHESRSPNPYEIGIREKKANENFLSNPPPASPPGALEELKSLAPLRQAPIPQTVPGKVEMRIHLEELRTFPAESALQDSETESNLDKQIERRDLWLARIHHLNQAGRTEEAKAQLRRFIARYPDHPLDASLRELLEDTDRAPHE